MKHIIIFLLAVIPLVSCGGKRDSEREIAEAFVLLDGIMDNQDAIAAGKAALGDKLSGTIVKEIYVPKKIINIVVK